MVTLHPEYVVDDNDKTRAVILPVDEWERVIDELEELEDIRLYDAAKQKGGESVPFEETMKEVYR
jgi:PHD/YefM family antitoxin component YafN of YafNO toxin-antitoxin module